MATLLTFLGTANYSETTYTLGRQRHRTRYCPAAIAHFVQPATTLVVVTKDAEAKHFEPLADEIAGVTRPIPVPIPDGHSEADLWVIFDALTGHIEPGAELVVDITNGFRSLPFLSFLALAYLRVAKGVAVNRVYYGAWDARNRDSDESPVFDLTPFVTLLDWTTATDQFLATGDTAALAARLKAAHREPWMAQLPGQDTSLPRHLQSMAGTLDTLGTALRLVRPEQVLDVASTLQTGLQTVKADAGTWAKPFGLLLDRTAADYEPLALAGDPRAPENAAASLERQRRLVRWYVDRRQYVQAIVLAREWIVSYVTLALKWDLIEDRQNAEDLLSMSIRLRRKSQSLALGGDVQQFVDAAVDLWDKVPDLRNDLAHAGMRKQPRPVAKIIQAAEALPPALDNLPWPFDDAGDKPSITRNSTVGAGQRPVSP